MAGLQTTAEWNISHHIHTTVNVPKLEQDPGSASPLLLNPPQPQPHPWHPVQ
uniref:Uncharacterized protein n=1 Tax=Anguilla anguilla TaxID=7936 RepID=A0A0E9W7F5_ANGAN